ncbi:MAG: hypothetical protein AAGI66_07330 [Cyanobacteria bacterium P01_H01_bin.74]
MPHYYFLRNDGMYSDAANYSQQPEMKIGGLWVEGKPIGLTVYSGEVDLNTKLDKAFQDLLPQHLGQPYLTDAIIASIFRAKVSVIEANIIDTSGELAKAIIRDLDLPAEMVTDKLLILNSF